MRGLAGFGMAILLVPVLGLAIAPSSAVVVAHVLGFVVGLPELRMMWRESEHSARIIAALAVLATPAGMALLAITPPDLARLLIAAVAIAAFVIVLLP
ncbi:MAG TPA: sulfite exporter TauE/SafE family protein, partial [Novosphingobium sp.]|nr:sulfite exporter TauE/SafE family protein [Novosphingobium sp.]